MTFLGDEETVKLCHYFLSHFHLAPDVTLRQDEELMIDIRRMNNQIEYKRWVLRHDLDDTPEPFGADVPNYRALFGEVEAFE